MSEPGVKRNLVNTNVYNHSNPLPDRNKIGVSLFLAAVMGGAPASPVVIHIVDTMAKAFGSGGRNQDALP
jgi:hypothetical protein